MKRRIAMAAAAFSAATMGVSGCTDLRSLYDLSDGVLHVRGSWQDALGVDQMHDATILVFRPDGRSIHYLSSANFAELRIGTGDYDVALFNGVMESESRTNLDHIYFRGSNKFNTFEVCAEPSSGSSRLSRAEGEVVVSNQMELFTFAHHAVSFDEQSGYLVKYENGILVRPDGEPWMAGQISSQPRAMSFRYRVRLTNLINPRGVRVATGALRGFVGSIYVPHVGQHPRPGFDATHHLSLTASASGRTQLDDTGTERGGVDSPWFVTFGPPVVASDDSAQETSGVAAEPRRYTFEVVLVLADGSEVRPEPFDVTPQVEAHIERIRAHHGPGEDIALDKNTFEIVIDDEILLPRLSGGNTSAVGVNPWGVDEEVLIWI